MFEVRITPEALDDLQRLRKHESKRIFDELERQLTVQPAIETRNRKRLRPNRVAEWELRIDRFRIFYDVNDPTQSIKIVAVGYKRGSRLYIRERKFNYEDNQCFASCPQHQAIAPASERGQHHFARAGWARVRAGRDR
ncbi:MAG: type II toxin-antitoxin system RelE family toxin [Gammaproteobacteria bacterium]